MSINFCPTCGGKLEPGVKSCPSCGNEINAREISKAEVSQPQVTTQKPAEIIKGPHIYAGFWERFFAYIVDIIVILLISLFIPFRWSFVFSIDYLFINDLIDWVIGFGYFFIFEAFNKGQTIGKILLHLRTVDEESLDVAKPGQYVVNNLARGTIFLLLDLIIGFLVNSGEENNRLRILQNISRTVVIKTS